MLFAAPGAARGDHREAAGDDRVGNVFRRAPYRLPARAFRIRAREREPAIRLVVSARASVLQLGAAEPAVRAAGPRAGVRAGGEPVFRRRRTRDLRKGDCARVGALSRADARARADGARNPRRHLARDARVAREARAESGAAIGKARDRSGAVRPAGGGVHHDGAHAFGDRVAPAVADERGERHADRGAAGDRRDGGAGARDRSAIFRPLRQRADGRRRRNSRARRGAMARRSRANSMRGSTDLRRG